MPIFANDSLEPKAVKPAGQIMAEADFDCSMAVSLTFVREASRSEAVHRKLGFYCKKN
jgi:hypothetical protein